MRELSLWRALLGVEKTVFEDIEFDPVQDDTVRQLLEGLGRPL